MNDKYSQSELKGKVIKNHNHQAHHAMELLQEVEKVLFIKNTSLIFMGAVPTKN